uniref:Serpin domain-containing protein n=1 Tax=Panagrolaimus sp. PS1159 TaxID=55785 RepID=A0AC35FIS5_9BILA
MSSPIPSMIEAQTDFALSLLRENGFNSSTILSPISISIALAMVYLGAKENTAKQIKHTIAKGVADEEIHAHFSSVLSRINSNNLNVTLESVNRVYLQNNFKLLDNYIEGIKQNYGGELEEIDFSKSSAAADKINEFVSKSTHDKIQNLISPNSLNDLTRLALINAIYFNGEWDEPFEVEITRNADFYVSPGNTKKVKMMSIESKFPYFETNDYQMLGLPYKNQKVFMYVILPRERFGLENLVKNMNSSTLFNLLSKRSSTTKVDVQFPRFKIEASFELTNALKKLGITEAFEDNANFLGISEQGNLKISQVVHKAFIEVSEEGTTAAAATHVGFQHKMFQIPKTFSANHPFLFIIADDAHNIYFIGRHLE